MSDFAINFINLQAPRGQLKFCWLLRMVLCFSVSSFLASAQEPVYRQYTMRDGLPSNVIYSAVQDDQGFMWFGTDAGVVRFDGKKFQHFSVNDGLPDNDLLRLFKDSKGRIWFLSLNGKLSFYYNGQIHNADNDRLVPKQRSIGGLISAHEDRGGELWFGGLSNNIINIRCDSSCRFFSNDFLLSNRSITSQVNFFEPFPNVIYANAGKRIFEYDKKTLRPTPVSLFDDFGEDYRFFDMGKGKCLVIMNGFLLEIRNNKIERKTKLEECVVDHTTRISFDADQSLWMMNSDKKNLYYKKMATGYASPIKLLPNLHVSQVYLDSEKNSWVCTNGDGLIMINHNKEFITQIKLGSDESPAINCLLREKKGVLLAGSENGWVYRISKEKIDSVFLSSNSMKVNRIMDMAMDQDGNLFCAADCGLYVISRDKKGGLSKPQRIFGKNGENHLSFKSVIVDNNGAIYTSNRNFIAPVTRSTSGRFFVDTPLLFSGRTYALSFDKSNTLWFEQFERLNYVQRDLAVPLPELDSLFLGKITDIEFPNDGRMIIATFGKGVQILDGRKHLSTINTQKGLAGNYCNKLFFTNNEWFVATTSGVSLIKWHDNTIPKIESYTVSDGLLSDAVVDIVAEDSMIAMATPLGLCILNRAIEKQSALSTQVVISDVWLNNQNTSLSSKLQLKKSSDKIKFRFVAPEFVSPEKVTYEYRLNLSEEWQVAPTQDMEFSNLVPGDYVFQVRAKKYNSGWSAPVAARFRVIPLFYETLAFKISLGGFLAVIFYLSLRQITSRKLRRQLRQLEQQRLIEAERRRISADMHDDFGADLTQIVLLSRLAKNKSDRFEVINQIETASLDVITKMNEIIWALNPVNDTLPHLASYLRRLSNEFSDASQISVEFTTNGELPEIPLSAALRRNLFLIFKEAIRNITKHAGASRVEVLFNYQPAERCIRMGIKDDGKGFNSAAKSEYGNGLLNMRKRAEEINAQLNFVPTAKGGTHIEIMVPLNF